MTRRPSASATGASLIAVSVPHVPLGDARHNCRSGSHEARPRSSTSACVRRDNGVRRGRSRRRPGRPNLHTAAGGQASAPRPPVLCRETADGAIGKQEARTQRAAGQRMPPAPFTVRLPRAVDVLLVGSSFRDTKASNPYLPEWDTGWRRQPAPLTGNTHHPACVSCGVLRHGAGESAEPQC
jgi:hypothetical protein